VLPERQAVCVVGHDEQVDPRGTAISEALFKFADEGAG
jgi:hypothetical protein